MHQGLSLTPCRPTSDFNYRADIDGLRAVAVVLVLLFHAGLGFSGGFVGVDVFFVISGYLITGLILKEQQAGSFRIAEFWARRIRRIVPAVTVVVAATLVAGAVMLLPSDFEDLAKSAAAQQLISSNLFFWKQTGYFDGPAELKPLLHTWSLAVEEQFYLAYPVMLVIARRWPRRFLALALIAGTIVSFGICEYVVRWDQSAAFFLLPTRAWEMLLGGAVCVVPMSGKQATWLTNLLSWVGFACILGSAWCFDASTRFPGAAALLPCLGAALLIHANSQDPGWLGRRLSARPVVFVGRLSYSLYLWHWPLLVFARHGLGEELSAAARMLVLVASFALAYLSWRFVETPFRSPRLGKFSWRPYQAMAVSGTALLAVSLAVVTTAGMPLRFSTDVLQYDTTANVAPHAEFEVAASVAARGDFPVLGRDSQAGLHAGLEAEARIDCLVWGDSHAMVLGQLSREIAVDSNLRCAFATRSGIAPLLGVWSEKSGRQQSAQWSDDVLRFVEAREIRNVILVARWSYYVDADHPSRAAVDQVSIDVPSPRSKASRVQRSKQALCRGLNRTIDRLTSRGIKVWIMWEVPCQSRNPNRAFARTAMFGTPRPVGDSRRQHRLRQQNVRDAFLQLRNENFTLLDPSTHCFDDAGNSKIADAGGSFYWDDDHLTGHGAETLLRKLLAPAFLLPAEGSEPHAVVSKKTASVYQR